MAGESALAIRRAGVGLRLRPGKLWLGLACVIFVYARSIALYCVGEGRKVTTVRVEVKQLMPHIRLKIRRK